LLSKAPSLFTLLICLVCTSMTRQVYYSSLANHRFWLISLLNQAAKLQGYYAFAHTLICELYAVFNVQSFLTGQHCRSSLVIFYLNSLSQSFGLNKTTNPCSLCCWYSRTYEITNHFLRTKDARQLLQQLFSRLTLLCFSLNSFVTLKFVRASYLIFVILDAFIHLIYLSYPSGVPSFVEDQSFIFFAIWVA